jgi:hypothetical protein
LWIPDAFRDALAGFGIGALLGLFGVALTRWEHTPGGLHYTPNRWLVLGVTTVVAGRLAFGFWRTWQSWHATGGGSWAVQSGAAGALAAGALVLGYYLLYWMGVRRRVVRSEGARRPRRFPG